MPPRRKPAPSLTHATCSICRDIPDRCRSFDKGSETVENTIPSAVSKLAIVGAPFYHQETSHSNWCLLRCPECGTCYDWDFEYEYLAGGSEDDLTVTRLSPEEGEAKAREVAGHVAAARARFAAESPAHLEALLRSSDRTEVSKAASWFFSAQADGNDLTDLLPALLAARQRPEAEGDAASSINLILFVHRSRSGREPQTPRR